jgi:hypothetical protein
LGFFWFENMPSGNPEKNYENGTFVGKQCGQIWRRSHLGDLFSILKIFFITELDEIFWLIFSRG